MTINKYLLFQLNKDYSAKLQMIYDDINYKKIDPETYVLNILNKFNLNVIYYQNNTNSNDDGVDFIVKIDKNVFIIQLKFYLAKSLSKKNVKCIYGDLLLSNHNINLLNKNYNIKYIILSPFISKDVLVNKNTYLDKFKLHLVQGENFIKFLTNPRFFLNNL